MLVSVSSWQSLMSSFKSSDIDQKRGYTFCGTRCHITQSTYKRRKAQWLRALTTLVEDLSLVPDTHIWQFTPVAYGSILLHPSTHILIIEEILFKKKCHN